jgi:lipoprotein-releasing system ATP-binding protein
VTLSRVGHRFGCGSWLFRGLTCELLPGKSYALTGPSGSGKSTLLSLLAGWEQPAEGEISRDGGGRIGWVFQNPYGVPRRTARDHVSLPLLAQGLTTDEADLQATDFLVRFGLERVADREFRSLSGGEAQRLMLARGIATKPALLLVDEPTAQLDLTTGEEVNRTLRELVTPETTVVVATHDEHTQNACTDHIDLRNFQASTPSADPPDHKQVPK